MTYSEMKRDYPWILEIFELASDLIHDSKSTVEMTLYHIEKRYRARIVPEHLPEVMKKLQSFCEAAAFTERYKNPPVGLPREQLPQPTSCPCCGSIELRASGCGWCEWRESA